MQRELLLKKLPPYKNVMVKLVNDQIVDDIIPELLKKHEAHKEDYKKICEYFIGSSAKETCRNIWQFLKRNVKYKIESAERQRLSSPAGIVALGTVTGFDCKNYSLFAAGILQALKDTGQQNIPFCFRFASYKWWDKTPQHVFVVAFPGTGREIWIDAVLPEFDQKKLYSHKIDKKPMALYSISGVQVAGPVQRKRRKERQARRKAECKGILNKAKRIATAPTRAAFTALVGLNAFGLARKLDEAIQTKEGLKAIDDWWKSECGNTNVLLRSIRKGKNKRRLFGYDDVIGCVYDDVSQAMYGNRQLGVAPAVLAAKAARLTAKVKKVLDKVKAIQKIRKIAQKTKKIRKVATKIKDVAQNVRDLSERIPV